MTQSSKDSTLRFFGRQDAEPGALTEERVAVLGYGNLGRAVTLNLRDAGVPHLVVGNVEDEYAQQAHADGFKVRPIAEAVAQSDVMFVLLPDEVIPEAFASDIAPFLQPGAAIAFASGYTLAYGLIKPADGIDVLLLAPRMGGELARERFLEQRGFFAYVAVEQDASGKAWRRLLGLAEAIGVLQAGALELDARTEADLDLFIEQTMGAVVGVAIMSAFSLGVEAQIPAEAMVLEMYMSGEMETVFRSFREKGFFRSADTHGPTAMYGGFIRTVELMQSGLAADFRQALEEIQSGEFARKFQAERAAGYPGLQQAQLFASEESPIGQPVAQAEARVRANLHGGAPSSEETV
jgi:ketol-acid reductoisomerase